MADYIRKRRTLHWPITLSAALMALNVTLMVCWIVLFAQLDSIGALLDSQPDRDKGILRRIY